MKVASAVLHKCAKVHCAKVASVAFHKSDALQVVADAAFRKSVAKSVVFRKSGALQVVSAVFRKLIAKDAVFRKSDVSSSFASAAFRKSGAL